MYGRIVTTIDVKPQLSDDEIESGLWQEVENYYPELKDGQEYGGIIRYYDEDGKIYAEYDVVDVESEELE